VGGWLPALYRLASWLNVRDYLQTVCSLKSFSLQSGKFFHLVCLRFLSRA
jgi:hypothetical protein